MSTPALRLAHDPSFGPPLMQPGAASGHGAAGPAPQRIVVGYGFWIFLLSDVIVFATLFAAYAVLFKNTSGGPSAHELFDLRNTAAETAFLLVSSFTCGMASLAVGQRSQKMDPDHPFDHRTPLARHDDGAVLRQGIRAAHPPPIFVL